MKPLFSLALVAFSLAFVISSCGSDQDVRDAAVDSVNVPAPATTPGTAPTTATPAANNSGVKHYICPKGCAGSGGDAAGTCPVCGTAYEHNSAFHNNTTTPATTPGTTAPDVTPVPNPVNSQAQNAAGEYHYICSKGCAGGAAAAGNCSKCGEPLAHNQAFHN